MIDFGDMPGGYKDGWSSWNPYNATCENCGSSNMEFYWTSGEPWRNRCSNCKDEGMNPK